jgi:hypothetical protein
MAFGDDDLDAIFSADDPFSVLATFNVSGDELEVYGQFTDGTDNVNLYGVDIEAQRPSITCRQSDIATVRNKMSVTIDGTAYTVERIEKSGAPGVATVYLKT